MFFLGGFCRFCFFFCSRTTMSFSNSCPRMFCVPVANKDASNSSLYVVVFVFSSTLLGRQTYRKTIIVPLGEEHVPC